MSNEELVIKIQNGIDTAENMLKLWEQTKKFISMIAKKYSTYAELEDLEQEGYLALYKAIDGYKQEEGIPFISYAAYWIKQNMRRYIENNNSTIRIPVHRYEDFLTYRRVTNIFYQEHGRKPTQNEIASAMGVSLKKVIQIECDLLMGQTGSIDMPIGEDEEDVVGNLIPGNDNIETEVLDRVEFEQLKIVLWGMVDTLPKQQGDVLHQKYQQGRKLREIGEDIGVSDSYVRQLEGKALWSLGHSKNARVLRSFLPEIAECTAYRHNGVSEFNRTWTSSTERAVLKML